MIWGFIDEYLTNLAIQVIRVRVYSNLGTVAILIYAAKMTVFRIARKLNLSEATSSKGV